MRINVIRFNEVSNFDQIALIEQFREAAFDHEFVYTHRQIKSLHFHEVFVVSSSRYNWKWLRADLKALRCVHLCICFAAFCIAVAMDSEYEAIKTIGRG